MLRPQVVADLELKRFGYDPIPLDPPFATFAADGTPILFHNDPAKAHASLARVSPRDADKMEAFEAMMERVADVLRPMMLRPPPAVGSKHPGDVLELLREAGRAAGPVAPRPARALPRDDDVGRRPARRLVRERRAEGRVRVDRRGRRVGRPAHARHGLQPAPPRARRARRRRRRVGAREGRDGRDLAGARRQREGARRGRADQRGGGVDRRPRRPRARRHAGRTASRSPRRS